MLIRYSPQRADRQLSYAFPDRDVIEATLDGVTDRFDFTGLPDGAEAVDIQSILDPCPVLSVRRVNGRLEVTLLRFLPAPPRREDYELDAEYEAALREYNRLAFQEPQTVWE